MGKNDYNIELIDCNKIELSAPELAYEKDLARAIKLAQSDGLIKLLEDLENRTVPKLRELFDDPKFVNLYLEASSKLDEGTFTNIREFVESKPQYKGYSDKWDTLLSVRDEIANGALDFVLSTIRTVDPRLK